MFATLTQDPTWGITGTDFLWGDGALCIAALATTRWLWLAHARPPGRPTPACPTSRTSTRWRCSAAARSSL